MAVISISIEESSEEIVVGVPRFVTISTNSPTTIFYTLDGSPADVNSLIYVTPVKMPTDTVNVILNIFATDGLDSATTQYTFTSVDTDKNIRRPHAGTIQGVNSQTSGILYPFGSNQFATQNNQIYTSSGDTGVTVDDPGNTSNSSGFDADGYANNFSNNPFNLEYYKIKYTKDQNNNYIGVGTLPGQIKIVRIPEVPEEDSPSNKLFNPQAMVLYQDVANEDPSLPPIINRSGFTVDSDDSIDKNKQLFNTGGGGNTLSMQFLRQHFNPRDNTMTYYYFDSTANRWLISKIPYTPKPNLGNLSTLVMSRRTGIGIVFNWLPYQRRSLF